jgi:hypothetical protein
VTLGTVTLEFGDGSTLDVQRVNARVSAASYDRHMFRSPYGTKWMVEGSGQREPEEFTLSCEVWGSTIHDSAPLVTSLLNALRDAVLITSPAGVFVNAGIVRYAQSPIVNGYRLDVTLLAEAGRLADDEGILRFMSGRVWEMG